MDDWQPLATRFAVVPLEVEISWVPRHRVARLREEGLFAQAPALAPFTLCRQSCGRNRHA